MKLPGLGELSHEATKPAVLCVNEGNSRMILGRRVVPVSERNCSGVITSILHGCDIWSKCRKL